MQIVFYKTTDTNNTVPKTKTEIATLTGTLKEACSITSPVIRVNRNTNDTILTANYAYIAKFNRYYFINDIVVDGQFFIVSCKCDVLDSFWDEWKNSNQCIDRQETQFNVNLQDPLLPITSEKKYKAVPIGTSPFTVSISGDGFFPIVLNAANAGSQL